VALEVKMKLLFWKKRAYPIKRDDDGRSLRSRAFALFDQDYRPSQIYKEKLLEAKPRTLYRYHQDWRKKKGKFRYRVLRDIMKRNPDVKQQIIKGISKQLEMPEDEVIWRMGRPWGLLQYLRGQWPDKGLQRVQSTMESRLGTALWYVNIIELFHNDPEQISDLLVELSMMSDKKKLIVTRKEGKLIIERENCNYSKPIELPAFEKRLERLTPLKTKKVTSVNK